MALVVVAAAAVRRLVAVERARAVLGDELAAASDVALGAWLDRASAAAERVADRVFPRERVRETRLADGPIVVLSRRPVVAVHSVERDAAAAGVADWSLDDPEAGILRLLSSRGGVPSWYDEIGPPDYHGGFRRGLSIIRAPSVATIVEYTAGYGLGPADDPPRLPADVEGVILDAVRSIAANGKSLALGVTSERLGDYGYTLQAAEARRAEAFLPEGSMAALLRYRSPSLL